MKLQRELGPPVFSAVLFWPIATHCALDWKVLAFRGSPSVFQPGLSIRHFTLTAVQFIVNICPFWVRKSFLNCGCAIFPSAQRVGAHPLHH